ncbi:transcription factor HES-3 [Hippopotamus amphibius kiboko]|uniref:transcription factor HES-3 n=1 Tax=Hippopotamus amphibius kiboko TaxID=575201 RepID=UPI00259379D6|nr:transcription factor HES-3 [Hippopotamus amphibius kiboko]
MGTEPETQGSSGSPASNFRKISKPLMEKKRRARINVSLEQLKSLLEKHYSHQIRKRKLEKADILELSVKYMKSLQNSVQGLWPVPSGAEYPGFRGCLPGLSQLLRRGEEGGGGLRCPLVHESAGGSTMDSASPGPEAPARLGPCASPVWAAAPAAGGSRSPPPRLLFSGGLPGPTTSIPAPQSASRRFAESPEPGLRLWRPW